MYAIRSYYVSFNGKIGSYHHFLHPPRCKPCEQLIDMQSFGADAIERRKCSVQHMVATTKGTATLDGDEILRLFDDAKQPVITARVGTERTGVAFGNMKAVRAEPHFLFELPSYNFV